MQKDGAGERPHHNEKEKEEGERMTVFMSFISTPTEDSEDPKEEHVKAPFSDKKFNCRKVKYFGLNLQ